jgi:hypothetical protein
MSQQNPKADFWKPGMQQPSSGNKIAAPAAAGTPVAAESKRTLSKGVLGMKFMKKKEDDAATKPVSASKDDAGTESIAATVDPTAQTFVDPYAALPGRRSFNGCNKAVERYYESKLEDLNYKKRAPSNTGALTVSDEDILKRYENLVGLPRGPNQGQRPVEHQSKNKPKRGLGAPEPPQAKKNRKN